MEKLRNALLCLLLGFLCVAVLRGLFLMDQAAIVLGDVHAAVASLGPPLTGAAIELRSAAREQRGYYKATGKALAITVLRLARLVENTDLHIGKLSQQAHSTLKTGEQAAALIAVDGHELLAQIEKQTVSNGYEASLALAAARGNFEQMERLWPPLQKGAGEIARSAENVEHATGSIKTALEPLRKPAGRWKWLFQWLLGLPKVAIR